MKIILILLLLIAMPVMATNQVFSVNLKLYKPISITKIQDLTIPDQTLTGSAFDVTVLSTDAGAAVFNAQGGKNRSIARSIVEAGINMSAPGVVGTIVVDTFTVSGPVAFDGSGNANTLRVGATAHILAGSEDGNYTGTATFSVVYN